MIFIHSGEKMLGDSVFNFDIQVCDSVFKFDFQKMGDMPHIQHFGDSSKQIRWIQDKKVIRIDGDKHHVVVTSEDEKKPIFVIDGQLANGLENIEPDQIKSINVLKGEKATKKYGEKAKNGVVEIKTKNGKNADKKARQELDKNEAESNRLKVYPNPNNGKSLNVEFDNPENQAVSIALFDTEGKLIKEFHNKEEAKGKLNYRFSGLDLKGLFILKVRTSKGEWNQKVVLWL